MDSSQPPAPPAAFVLPVAARPMAYGDRPLWTLVPDRAALILTLDRRPPMRLVNRGWRDSPAGRRLTMGMADGRTATLTIVHGLCRPASGPASGAMIAILAIGDLRLHGCFDGGGGGGDRLMSRPAAR